MASGDVVAYWDAASAIVPATGGPQLDVRNNHPVLDFDPTTAEACLLRGFLPTAFGGIPLTVALHLAFSSATSGGGRFLVSFERIGVTQDIDADSFATAKVIQVTAPATSGALVVGSVGFATTEIDGLLGGEAFRIMVQRDAGDATNDTAAGDAELIAAVLTET